MSRMLSSTSDFHGMMPSSVGTFGVEQDVEMKLMEEETTSTVDSSTLLQQQSFASEYSYHGATTHGSNAMRPVSKGKAMKKMKNDEEDEEIDIDKCVNDDSSRVSVKILRKIIPKLRIVCYYSDEQVSGKRKLKHLWDEKPADWPNEVPFKDPNNAIKDTKKPGKDELAPMYEFLRKKYLEKKSYNEAINGSHTYTGTMNSGTGIATGNQESVYHMYQGMSHAQPADDSSGITYMTATSASYGPITVLPSSSEDNKDNKLWTMQPWPPLEHSSYSSEEARSVAMLAPTRTEHPTRGLHHQHMNTINIPETIPGTWESQVRLSGHIPNSAPLPSPVKDLYSRLKEKQREVEIISGHNSEVKLLLASVQKDVMDCIYEKLTSDDTRLCLMFLDAGHQYEALLDVMLVLGNNNPESGGLLTSGCQEIINKFKKECVTLMSLFGVMPPRFGSMISSSVKSAVYGVSILEALPYSNSLLFPTADDDKTKQLDDMSVSMLGIRERPTKGQGPALNSLLEIRTTDPDALIMDHDKNKLDDKDFEEIMKEFFLPSSSETQQVAFIETEAQTPSTAYTCSSPNAANSISFQSGLVGSEPATNVAEGMDFELDLLTEVIANNSDLTNDVGAFASDPLSSASSWSSGATGPVSLVSTSDDFSSYSDMQFQSLPVSHSPYQSMPVSQSPYQSPAASRSPYQPMSLSGINHGFARDSYERVERVAQQSVSPAIPLSVFEASVDDFDAVNDQRQNSRRRPRQSRASVSSRASNQSNGRT